MVVIVLEECFDVLHPNCFVAASEQEEYEVLHHGLVSDQLVIVEFHFIGSTHDICEGRGAHTEKNMSV